MKLPLYRRHSNGQAFVCHRSIRTKDHRKYLGLYDTPESKRRYAEFINKLLSDQVVDDVESAIDDDPDLAIVELAAQYLVWAQTYYAKTPSELYGQRNAVAIVVKTFGDLPGAKFGPRRLLAIQRDLVDEGHARTTVNKKVGRIKRFIKWCSIHELVPPHTYNGLRCVDGLKPGQFGVGEARKRPPISIKDVKALYSFLSPTLQAMVKMQYYCGMRPGEVTIIRRCDIDMSGSVWLYRPETHKNSWRGVSLVKAIPEVARAIIRPFFTPDAESYLFSPLESRRWYRKKRLGLPPKTRKTKVFPCELRRREREQAERDAQPRRTGDHFTAGSYSRAVRDAFERAERVTKTEMKRWCPKQLRNGIATELSLSIGEQAAQRWLGHTNLNTTGIYVERDVSELIQIAEELDRRWAV